MTVLSVLRLVLYAARVLAVRAALVLALLLPLAPPAALLADDCADTTVTEARSCANNGIGKAYPMLGAAFAAMMGALAMAKGRPLDNSFESQFPEYFGKKQPWWQRKMEPADRLWRGMRQFFKDSEPPVYPRAVSGVRG
jgi:hypothetical protein